VQKLNQKTQVLPCIIGWQSVFRRVRLELIHTCVGTHRTCIYVVNYTWALYRFRVFVISTLLLVLIYTQDRQNKYVLY